MKKYFEGVESFIWKDGVCAMVNHEYWDTWNESYRIFHISVYYYYHFYFPISYSN